MIICENNGEYKAYIADAPFGSSIEAAVPFSQGFLVAQAQSIYVYKTSQLDDTAPIVKSG
jgi:hypothetical protein